MKKPSVAKKLGRFLAILVMAIVLAGVLGTFIPRPLLPAAAAD
ncbi:MAG: TIGR02117 family protein, partial [Mesorhizobium sp.]